MTRPIVNLDALELRPWGHGGPSPPGLGSPPAEFEAHIGDIGGRVGAKLLGGNLTVVPSGKRAYPFHVHTANEEWFLVLDGSGELRWGEERYLVRRGDLICCPPGGLESAHQLVNTGDTELRYFAVSTRNGPEVCLYPDTGRMGVAHYETSTDGSPRMTRVMASADRSSYWDGE